jgi:signal transduction histidine kinase
VVFDLNAADAGPIYTWIGDGSDIRDPKSLRRNSTSRHDQANTIEFARQSWEIVLHPRPGFEANTQQRFSAWVLAGGLFMTGMILLALARMQRSQRGRARAQAQIEQLNAHLEQRVVERTQQLEAAMQTLRHSQEDLSRSESRATLGMLAASVSHEMGTPMGNSMMTASTLVDQSRAFEERVASGALRRSDLDQFLQQVNEGNALLVRNLERAADLLKSFRQVAADQASEQRRAFDLAQAVQEVVDTLAPSLKSKPHRVVLDIAAGIAMDSYPGPLGQVVINLINNAFLHAFDDHTPGLFTIAAHAEGDSVELRFQDNGKGISRETLEHMFVPFFSTKIGKGGTGLGMSIVENLVTKTLGGRVAVQSTLGEGTVVTVSIPLQAPRTEGDA